MPYELSEADLASVAERVALERKCDTERYQLVMNEIAEEERKATDILRRCEIRRQVVNATYQGRTQEPTDLAR